MKVSGNFAAVAKEMATIAKNKTWKSLAFVVAGFYCIGKAVTTSFDAGQSDGIAMVSDNMSKAIDEAGIEDNSTVEFTVK